MHRLFCNCVQRRWHQPDNVTFGLGGRLTFLDVGGFGSELRTDFAIGNVYGISSEYYKRFVQIPKWFYSPELMPVIVGSGFYSNDNPQADYRIVRAGVGATSAMPLTDSAKCEPDTKSEYLNVDLRPGTPAFSSVKGQVGDTRLRLVTDHLDEPVVPLAGYFGQLNFHFFDKSPGSTLRIPKSGDENRVFQTSVFEKFALSGC